MTPLKTVPGGPLCPLCPCAGLAALPAALACGSTPAQVLTDGQWCGEGAAALYPGVSGDQAVITRPMAGVSVPPTRTLNPSVRLSHSYNSRPPAGG